MNREAERERKYMRMAARKRLSILVPTLHTRIEPLRSMVAELHRQTAERDDVEILALLDNQTMSLGSKRSKLASLARGDYLTFVNDDDAVSPNYVERVMALLGENPGVDVLCISAECQMRDGPGHPWTHRWYMKTGLSARFDWEGFFYPDPDGLAKGPGGQSGVHFAVHGPVMWCVWRREVAQAVPFPDMTYGEDVLWAQKAKLFCESEARTDEVLYRYYADDTTSEAGLFCPEALPIRFAGTTMVNSGPRFIDHFRSGTGVASATVA